MKKLYIPKSHLSFREPFDSEYDDSGIQELNPNILELQSALGSSIQYLESMLCDIEDAIKQGDMTQATPYLQSAQDNLDNALSSFDYITIQDIIEDVKLLQQQRIVEQLRD